MPDPENIFVAKARAHAEKAAKVPAGPDSVNIDGEIFLIPGLRGSSHSSQPRNAALEDGGNE